MKPFPGVLEKSATFDSYDTDWLSVGLEAYNMPAGETPKFSLESYFIPVNIGQSFQCKVVVDNRVYNKVCFPGCSLILPPNSVSYTFCWDGPVDAILLNLSSELLANTASELFDNDQFELPCKLAIDEQLIYKIALNLRAELLAGSPHGVFYSEHAAIFLATHLLCFHSNKEQRVKLSKGGLPPKQLKTVIEYINESLGEDLRIKKLANLIHLSCSHFIRMFKESTGICPYEYVKLRRIERAKHLLRRGDEIGKISLECGFSSHSHFSTSFKKETGMTPSQFRDTSQKYI